MRMQYVLKPLALSVLALGLLFTGTPVVQAAPDKNGQQNYKQSGDRLHTHKFPRHKAQQ